MRLLYLFIFLAMLSHLKANDGVNSKETKDNKTKPTAQQDEDAPRVNPYARYAPAQKTQITAGSAFKNPGEKTEETTEVKPYDWYGNFFDKKDYAKHYISVYAAYLQGKIKSEFTEDGQTYERTKNNTTGVGVQYGYAILPRLRITGGYEYYNINSRNRDYKEEEQSSTYADINKYKMGLEFDFIQHSKFSLFLLAGFSLDKSSVSLKKSTIATTEEKETLSIEIVNKQFNLDPLTNPDTVPTVVCQIEKQTSEYADLPFAEPMNNASQSNYEYNAATHIASVGINGNRFVCYVEKNNITRNLSTTSYNKEIVLMPYYFGIGANYNITQNWLVMFSAIYSSQANFSANYYVENKYETPKMQYNLGVTYRF
jgi:hypothetical protein